MEHIKELTIPIDASYSLIPIFAKQGDFNSRYFHVTLTEGGRALTANEIGTVSKAAIGIKRSRDRESKCFSATYNNDGTFTLPLPSFATEYANDNVKCDLMVWASANGVSKLIRSACVVVHVQEAGCSDVDISKDENVDLLSSLIEQVQNVETTILDAEEKRASAEAGRVSAENTRNSNEQARATAESNRATAETARATAERGRATAEQGRATAEAERVTAEAGRVSEYTQIMNSLGDSLENINGAAESAEIIEEIYSQMNVVIYFNAEGRPCYKRK